MEIESKGNASILTVINNPLFKMCSDVMVEEDFFDNPVKVDLEVTGNWEQKEKGFLQKEAIVWYTDGSKSWFRRGYTLYKTEVRHQSNPGSVNGSIPSRNSWHPQLH